MKKVINRRRLLVLATRSAAKFEKVPSTTEYPCVSIANPASWILALYSLFSCSLFVIRHNRDTLPFVHYILLLETPCPLVRWFVTFFTPI